MSSCKRGDILQILCDLFKTTQFLPLNTPFRHIRTKKCIQSANHNVCQSNVSVYIKLSSSKNEWRKGLFFTVIPIKVHHNPLIWIVFLLAHTHTKQCIRFMQTFERAFYLILPWFWQTNQWDEHEAIKIQNCSENNRFRVFWIWASLRHELVTLSFLWGTDFFVS